MTLDERVLQQARALNATAEPVDKVTRERVTSMAGERLRFLNWPESVPLAVWYIRPHDDLPRDFDGKVRINCGDRFVFLPAIVDSLSKQVCLLCLVGPNFQLVDKVAEALVTT